jgi:hypothetical protein
MLKIELEAGGWRLAAGAQAAIFVGSMQRRSLSLV